MSQPTLPGVFRAKKKDGTIYYRSSFTYKNKHISLGSFSDEATAHRAYQEALTLTGVDSGITLETLSGNTVLSFEKCIVLLNFRDNDIYIRNPVYLRSSYFEYHYSEQDVYLFDIDDLFYYSVHKLMKRNGHLFVADYGMQVSILSRYGIKAHAVAGQDFEFINSNPHDLRYENIRVLNPYYGVRCIRRNETIRYHVRIHIRGNYTVGTYQTVEEAAIAYNKAIDVLKKAGCTKNYQQNYLEHLTGKQYAEIYSRVHIASKLYKLTFCPPV